MRIGINRLLESGKLVKVGNKYEWNKILIGQNKEMTIAVAISPPHLRSGTRIWVSWIELKTLKKKLLIRCY